MDLPGQFRTRAQHCLALSREAATIEAQSHWVAMAQFWFNLSEMAEHQDNDGTQDASLPRPPDELEPQTGD
jgi:hypothetical protein